MLKSRLSTSSVLSLVSDMALNLIAPQSDEYHLALGRFVHAFSEIENAVQILLSHKAGVSNEKAKAIFSGVTIKTAVEHIQRLFEVDGQEVPTYLKGALSHLGVIISVRNDILHFGANLDVETLELYVTNERSSIPRKITKTLVSAKYLDDMRADLFGITSAILHVILADHGAGDNVLSVYLKDASSPWRYKRIQPSKSPGKTRRSGAKSPHPPKS